LTKEYSRRFKIALATLITGIWFPSLVFIPALVMAFLMICTGISFQSKNPWFKHLPSLLLLALSLFVALSAYNNQNMNFLNALIFFSATLSHLG
jgi:uncharacterized membrane protein YjdF